MYDKQAFLNAFNFDTLDELGFIADMHGFDGGQDYEIYVRIVPNCRLETALDCIRDLNGERMFYFGENPDCDGWYNFYVECKKDCVADVFGEVAEDCGNEEEDNNEYVIPLTDECKRLLFDKIRTQFNEAEFVIDGKTLRWEDLFL